METATGEIHAKELYDYEIDSLETKSFINDPGYSSIISTLDSIVNDRIAIPSTQPKLHFQVYGKQMKKTFSLLPIAVSFLMNLKISPMTPV